MFKWLKFDKTRLQTRGEYVIHNAIDGEFRASTPEALVALLYENSRVGMGNISFEDWWLYQRGMYAGGFGMRLPDYDGEKAAIKLIRYHLKLGIYHLGPQPQPQGQ